LPFPLSLPKFFFPLPFALAVAQKNYPVALAVALVLNFTLAVSLLLVAVSQKRNFMGNPMGTFSGR